MVHRAAFYAVDQAFDVEGVALDADSLCVELAAVLFHEQGVLLGLGIIDLYFRPFL